MIVRTLLDTDLYKFTTSYAYIKLFPYAMGTSASMTETKLNIPKNFWKRSKANSATSAG